jgi:hypothetical protein
MTDLIQLSEVEIAAVAGGAIDQDISISATQTNSSSISQSATASNSGAVTAAASDPNSTAIAIGAAASNTAVVSQANIISARNSVRIRRS